MESSTFLPWEFLFFWVFFEPSGQTGGFKPNIQNVKSGERREHTINTEPILRPQRPILYNNHIPLLRPHTISLQRQRQIQPHSLSFPIHKLRFTPSRNLHSFMSYPKHLPANSNTARGKKEIKNTPIDPRTAHDDHDRRRDQEPCL